MTSLGPVHDVDRVGVASAATGAGERFAHAIVETIREPLLVLDEDLRVESANAAFYRHFRVAPPDTVDRSLFALGNGQWDIPALRHLLETLLSAHEEVRDLEVEHDFPHLGRRIMLVNARQVRDEEQAYGRILVAFEDVTEARRAARELQRYAGELERSNRELEEFAHAASHDLQEPLRKIGTFSDRLTRSVDEEALGADARLYLERIGVAVSRMQTRIDDLLRLARVGRERPRPELLDLGAVLASALDDLGSELPEDATVEVTELPPVVADRVRMELLFQNLLGNAAKYRRPDVPLSIGVRGESVAAGDPEERPGVLISVEDNGIGFEPRYAERIFGAFQRLHGRSEYEGSGVGLSICRRIVEQHGGTIRAHGRPGQGARFDIWLPATVDGTGDPT